ncbi:MAG: glycosyltransferase [Chloroflexi bacterium]|nr:glycosyltransferase [Chloroflexota bacterium]
MSDGPRVLLVTAEYAPTPGGVGDYPARLASALAAAGARPAILTSRLPAVAGVPGPDASAPATRLPVWRVAPGWGWRMPATIDAAATAWPADIVHVQYQTGAYGMRPAINLLPWWLRRRRHRPRLAVTFHDTRAPYLFPRAGRLRPAVNALLAGGSDLTITTNPADAAVLRSHARRLAILPIGANIEPDAGTAAVAARLRGDLHLGAGERLLVTFGLLNHSKGLPDLFQALARLNAPDATGRYRLALVGAGAAGLDPTDGATASDLHRLARDLDIAGDLLWTGHQPAAAVAGWLRAADAVALPFVDGASYRRGSLLAALACGAAVVTTTPAADHADDDIGLPPLRSGVHATLVAPGDPATLAVALAATAGDDWLNRTLRDGARALADRFAWPAIAARHLIEYEAMTATSAAP